MSSNAGNSSGAEAVPPAEKTMMMNGRGVESYIDRSREKEGGTVFIEKGTKRGWREPRLFATYLT
jgi:hypothetical protein